MALEIIDISRELTEAMAVWPGNRNYERLQLKSFEQGDGFRESEFAMNIHSGTHADAPAHFVEHGVTMDRVALESFIGRVLVVEAGDRDVLDAEFIRGIDLRGCDRVLFRTKNSSWSETEFNPHFVAFTPEAAQALCEKKIRLVGVDGPSIQRFHDPDNQTHQIILGAGIVVIEGLDLNRVTAGSYTLLALPMRLKGAEGAPVRATLIKGNFDESID